MKKAISLCLIVVFVAGGIARAETQPDHILFLPIVKQSRGAMGNWKVILPEYAKNLHANPSVEVDTTGWSAGGTNTVAQSSAQSKFGNYSLLCTYQDNGGLASYNLTLTAASHVFSAWVYIPANYDGTQVTLGAINYAGATGTTGVNADMTKTDQWQRLSITFTPDAGDLAGQFQIRETGTPTAGRFVYVDAVDAVPASEVSTHVDGDQPGCEWLGPAGLSASQRSALSRDGGVIRDFQTDYYLYLGQSVGPGMAPTEQIVDNYAILPGGEVQGHKTGSRSFSLSGILAAASSTQQATRRAALINVFSPSGIPDDQPFLLRYEGATVTKEIKAYYRGGLDGNFRASLVWNERISLQFLSTDPFWYEIGESSAALDTNDTATIRYAAGRLKSTGQWDDLGLTVNPTGAADPYAVLVASNGIVYVGGDFTNWNGIVNANYIAQYDPQTDTWSTVGPAASVNGTIRTIVEAANGDIYVGGAFTGLGGVGGDKVAFYDISAGSWSILASGGVGTVRALAFGPDGTLYIGGAFSNWNTIPTADNFVTWTGSAYAAIAGTALNGSVDAIAVRNSDNTVFIGGGFTDAGGDTDADHVSYHDGSDWTSLNSTPLGNDVFALYFDTDGTLYIGGFFANAGGDPNGDIICKWRDSAFIAMGTGMDAEVYVIRAYNGIVYVGGEFTRAGSVTVADKVAKWNGSTWARLDINWPTGAQPEVHGMDIGRSDPVIANNFDLFVTSWDGGAGAFSGATTVNHAGTGTAQPIITVKRTGGTSAKLVEIRNETTGKELLFDYDLLDGETLTIDLRSTEQSVISDFFGPRPDAILKASDVGSFVLIPGDNNITAFVDVAGGPTITSFITYRATYGSLD